MPTTSRGSCEGRIIQFLRRIPHRISVSGDSSEFPGSFQFLHRIPRSETSARISPPAPTSFNSFTGFHATARRLGIGAVGSTFNSFTGFHERLASRLKALGIDFFQFLHRIPPDSLWVKAENPEGYFQFLHRIPRENGSVREYWIGTAFNSFTGFHAPFLRKV